jgi:hypothetical protein
MCARYLFVCRICSVEIYIQRLPILLLSVHSGMAKINKRRLLNVQRYTEADGDKNDDSCSKVK